MILTNENFEALKPFESNFNTAIKGNYSRAIFWKDRNNLASLHMSLTGNPVKINIHCSQCVVDMLKELGEAYFAHKNSLLFDMGIPISKQNPQKRGRKRKEA